MYMIIIKIDCCGRPQTLCGLSIWMSSDAMRAKGLNAKFKPQHNKTVLLLQYCKWSRYENKNAGNGCPL